jgi:hypothetical protein
MAGKKETMEERAPQGNRRSSWPRKGIFAAFSERKRSNSAAIPVLPEKQEPVSKLPSKLQEQEIRLVLLEPRTTSGGLIRCTLVTKALEETRYEALSYEWGPRSPVSSVVIDGVDTPVRENLWWALQYLQLENETRVLWVDALCINQEDTIERNHQVSMMGKIYSSASRCIAWIGRERIVQDSGFEIDDCELAMDFINKRYLNDIEEDYSRGLSPQDKQEHDSLEWLCRRKYWSRLWIVQEIFLSSDVVIQCGYHQAPFAALSHVLNNPKKFVHASYQFSITRSPPFRLNQQRNVRIGGNIELSLPVLAELVLRFKGSKCEDSRDKVFSLLSMARDCCRNAVPANYSASLQEICNTLIVHHIVWHIDLTEKTHNITADIQELCEWIVLDSKKIHVSKQNDTSIASASMKAFRTNPVFPWSPPPSMIPAGKVIWIVSAGELQKASQIRRSKHLAQKPQSWQPGSDMPHDESQYPEWNRGYGQSQDLLELFLSKLSALGQENELGRSNAMYYLPARRWALERQSESSRPIRTKPAQLFLTDMGYSGLAMGQVELEDTAIKVSERECNVQFRDSNIAFLDTTAVPVESPRGVILDSETTFQELLSWVLL